MMDAVSYGQKKLTLIDRLTIQKRVSLADQILIQQKRNKPKDVLQVIEVGCGFDGLNLAVLQERHPDVNYTGVDIHVRTSFSDKINLISGDINKWLPEYKYDIVLSLAVVEHLLDPIHHFYLISQALKPGGVALLTSPTPPNHAFWGNLSRMGLLHDHISEHKLYLTKAGISEMANEANLSLIEYKKFQLGLNQWAKLKHK